jgi:hypothetical protein
MALKFNLKEIDYKKFLIERGEWIGVGVALLIALPVLGSGVSKALFSGSASKNATEVGNLATDLDHRIASSVVPEDAPKPPKESNLNVDTSLVDSSRFVTPEPWFINSQIEDTKRRKPEILSPSDFMTAVIRFGTLGYKTVFQNGKWYIVVITERDATLSPAQKKAMARLKKLQESLGSRGGMGMAGMMPGMGGMRGGGGMGMAGMGGIRGGGGMGMQGMGMQGGSSMMAQMMGGMRGGMGTGMMGGPGAATSGRRVREQKLEEVEKFNANANSQLAEELYTGRMVLVQAAFPAKEQLEMFRAALRKPSLADMVPLIDTDEFRFVNLDIERREVSPAGKELSPWEPYDKVMKAELTRLLAVALEVEQPDPELVENAMIPKRGLCWPLPKLELPYGDPEKSKYPRPTEIPSIDESLKKLQKLATETNQKVPSQLVGRISGQDIDPLDPLGMKSEQESASQEPAKPAAGDKPAGDQNADPNALPEPVLPEKVLVRFVDLTVVPGHTYQYRVRVVAANPNYKHKNVAYASLARDKEVVANDWAVVPPVTVPYDVNWYATDQRFNGEQATVQIQRWIDRWEPETPREKRVGDWVVWDNAKFYRGEYIGKVSNVAVPAWSIEKDDFELASASPRRIPAALSVPKLPVDFTVRRGNVRSPALLVDVTGGKVEEKTGTHAVKDELPVQVLVLTSDGALEMRSAAEDLEDKERTTRFEDYKKRIKEIQQGGSRRPGMNNLPGSDLFNKGGPRER